MRVVFIVALLLCFRSVNAQNQNNFGVFPVYSQTGKLTEKIYYNLFLFSAIDLNKSGQDWFLWYNENTLGYKISERISVAGSYTYQRSNVLQTYATNEHRLWQQIQYELPLNKKLILNQRVRFDERFIQDHVANMYPLSHRLRYLIGAKYTINEKYFVSTYNELFFKTSTPRSTVYGENWAFIGLGVKTSENTSLEIGPTYIIWVTNDALDRLNLWYLQVQFNTTINLIKIQ